MAPKFAVDIHDTDTPLQQAPININAAGLNLIIAANVGDIIKVYRLFLVAQSATNLTFIGGINLSGPLTLGTAQGLYLEFDTKPWFVTTPGSSLNINLSSPQQVSGVLYYTVVNLSGTSPSGFLLLEDGISHVLLEDGTSRLKLEGG